MDSPLPPTPSAGRRFAFGSTASSATADHAVRWRVTVLERQLEEAKSAAATANAALKSAQDSVSVLTSKIAQRDHELSMVQTELVDQQTMWATRTKKAKEKQTQLTFMEEAVVDVAAELSARLAAKKQRDPTVGADAFSQRSRDKWMEQMRTDHVVACDAVKALVRTVFSEWDAATAAATAPREEIIRKQTLQIRELQDRVRDAEMGRDIAVKRERAMADELKASEIVRDALVQDNTKAVEEATTSRQELIAEMQRLRTRISVLESAGAEVALKAAEDGDTGLKLLQKDHELAEIKFHEQVAIRKMQGQHDRVVKEYEKRLSRMTSLEQEVTELKGKLEKATAALRSSKMSFSAVKHSESANQIAETLRKLDKLTSDLAASNEANSRLEKQLAFKSKKLQTLQREYEIQREILATERQSQMPKYPGIDVPTADSAATNPHLLASLKRDVQERDAEITALKSKLKKLAYDNAQHMATNAALQSKLDRSSRVGDELKRKMETLGPEATILANSAAQKPLRPLSAVDTHRRSLSARPPQVPDVSCQRSENLVNKVENEQVLRAEYAKDVPTFEKLLAQANGEPDIDADIVEDDSDSGDVDTEFAAVESSSRKCSFTGDRRGSEASRPFSAASITALSAVVNLRRSSSAAYHKPDGTALPSQQLGLTRPVSATVLRTAKALSKREPSLPLSAVQEMTSQASVDKALLGIQHPLGKAIVHAKVVADHAISSANELSNMFPGVQSSPEVKQVTTGGRKPLVVRPASSSRLRPASASIPLKRTPSVL